MDRYPFLNRVLTPLVKQNYEAGRLLFSTDAAEGVAHATVQFIAVGTPPDEDGSADLKYVTAVARTIAEHMTEPKVVIDKSTVPVGTADKVRAVMTEVLKKRGVDIDFNVVFKP
jgi:UDPglucose 6-dehydrogenase